MEQTRRCSGCGETKPLDQFVTRPGSKTGYRTRCKACENARARARSQHEREKRRAYGRAYRARRLAEDPEAFRRALAKAARESYHRNREVNAAKARERMRRKRQEEGDAVRERDRAYWSRPENRERRRAQGRAFGARRTAEQRAQVRTNWERWKERNVERERARVREVQASRLAQKLNQFVEAVDPEVVVERDRGYCGICGLLVLGPYHIDHVTPLSRGGEHSYANVQLAHPFCNISKGAKLTEELAP